MARRKKTDADGGNGDLPKGPELVMARLNAEEIDARKDRLTQVCIDLKHTKADQAVALRNYRRRINGLEDEQDRLTEAISTGQEEREHPTLPMG
jgi:hypothetical protein